MPTLAAYLIVVAVWATTPLGIKWSGEAMAPLAAAGVRMGIAALLGSVLSVGKRNTGSRFVVIKGVGKDIAGISVSGISSLLFFE